MSEGREWPREWQMPGLGAVQNLQMPHPWDWQGGQMPRSSPGKELGAGGIDWYIKEKIAQNNSQLSEEGITVKPGQDSIHELII